MLTDEKCKQIYSGVINYYKDRADDDATAEILKTVTEICIQVLRQYENVNTDE